MLRWRERWWVLLCLLPFGIGTWAAFLYVGTQAHKRSWRLIGFGYLGLLIASFLVLIPDRDPWLALGGFGLLFAWAGGFVHALVIANSYDQAVASPEEDKLQAAEDRLKVREDALQLAQSDPEHAKSLGIGRPDLKGSYDAGLVDVNNAPARVIATLPNIDATQAKRIVDVREQVNGFSSAEDLGLVVDLPAGTIDDLHGLAIFLPR
jgi:DNA uptake protein ComE-like DNA-binding protein